MTENLELSLPVATAPLVCLLPSGTCVPVEIRIGRPYNTIGDHAACPIRIVGLFDDLVDQHGASSLQALLLAARLARSLLEALVKDGGRVLWPDTDYDVDLDILFAHLPSSL